MLVRVHIPAHRDRSEYKTDSSVMAVYKSVTIPGMTGHVCRNTQWMPIDPIHPSLLKLVWV